MTHDPQLTAFGLLLQSARIEKKISIEALSAETRIRVEVLKRLEAEDHEHLPDEVFVKGFIRTYANAVGADAEEALERYRASRTMRNVGREGQTARAPQPKRFWLVTLTAVGAVLLMAGLTLYGYSRLNAPDDESAVIPEPPAAVSAAPVTAAPPTTPSERPPTLPAQAPAVTPSAAPEVASELEAAAPASPPEPPPPSQQYRLEIKAVEDTWLKVIVDDQQAEEIMLKSGQAKQIEAQTHFNLLIGNAGGVELQLNGSPVEVAGKSGQVVNIQLP